MPSVAETAYPRLKSHFTAKELEPSKFYTLAAAAVRTQANTVRLRKIVG